MCDSSQPCSFRLSPSSHTLCLVYFKRCTAQNSIWSRCLDWCQLLDPNSFPRKSQPLFVSYNGHR